MVIEVVWRMEFIFCPEDREDWVVMGSKATQGCYKEGGGFNHFIVEEIGLYLDDRAEIQPGPDHEL